MPCMHCLSVSNIDRAGALLACRAFFTALDVNGSGDSVSWVEMFNRLIETVIGSNLMIRHHNDRPLS